MKLLVYIVSLILPIFIADMAVSFDPFTISFQNPILGLLVFTGLISSIALERIIELENEIKKLK